MQLFHFLGIIWLAYVFSLGGIALRYCTKGFSLGLEIGKEPGEELFYLGSFVGPKMHLPNFVQKRLIRPFVIITILFELLQFLALSFVRQIPWPQPNFQPYAEAVSKLKSIHICYLLHTFGD
jgi:hypothetical protein